MPSPLQVTLDQAALAELERRYHTTRDAPTRTRYQMVLLAAQGHTPPQIALLVRCSADTLRRVLKRYLAGGADAVPHRPHPGQPLLTPGAKEPGAVHSMEAEPIQQGSVAHVMQERGCDEQVGILGRQDHSHATRLVGDCLNMGPPVAQGCDQLLCLR